MFRLGLALALVVLALDQVTKALILDVVRLQDIGRIELSAIFDLTFVRNYGVSFGLFRAEEPFGRWLLVGVSGAIALGFAWWMRTAERRITVWALGLIVGGALGNLIDRVRFGYVVDFLDFSGLYFPYVFNVADAAINLGAGLMILDFILEGRRERAAAQAK